jgi:hypothetical protein
MKNFIVTILFALNAAGLAAQESHYHRSMRTQQDNEAYGTVGAAPHFNGGGVYWSRVRSAEMGLMLNDFKADTLKRRNEFIRLCQTAYDAYEDGDYYRTAIFGDSALSKKYYTPELYYFMAVSLEKLQCYKDADFAFKKAINTGYHKAPFAYANFKQHLEELKAQDKIRKKEARRNHEKFVPLSEGKDMPEPMEVKRAPNLQIISSTVKLYTSNDDGIIRPGNSSVLHFNLLNSGNAPSGKCSVKLLAKNNADALNIGTIPPVTVKPKETLLIDIPIEAETTITEGETELILTIEEPNGYSPAPRNIKVKTKK